MLPSRAARVVPVVLALALAGCSSPGSAPARRPNGSSPPRPPSGRLTAAAAGFRLPASLSRAVAFRSVSGHLLVISGLHDGEASTNAVVDVDPRSGQVTVPGRLPVAVHDAAGALLAGTPTVFGGGAAREVAAVQQYDPASHATRQATPLPTPASDVVAATIEGGVVVAGGYDGRTTLGAVLLVGPAAPARRLATLPVPVRYPAVAVVGSGEGQRVLLLGGESDGVATDAVQEIDVGRGQARLVGHLPAARTQASALVLGGTVFLAGGASSGTRGARQFDDVLRYDPTSHTLSGAGSLPYPVADAAAVAADDSTGYLIGGETPARTDRSIVVRLGP